MKNVKNKQKEELKEQVPELKVRVEVEVTQGIVLEDCSVEECEAFIGVFFKEDAFGMTIVGGVSRSRIESAYLRLGQYLGDKFDRKEVDGDEEAGRQKEE